MPAEYMDNPEFRLRSRLLGLLEDVGADAEIELDVRDDKIHDSLGQDRNIAGCYPTRSGEWLRDGQVMDVTVMVQFFLKWDREVNPDQTVAPGEIEQYAERFRRACRADELGATGADQTLWYYRILSIEYPDDPTGNKTRFLATVQGSAQNSGLVETS